ncbi:hypothetical protein ACTFIV_002042 [Dictyostelium citrinum]
MRILKLAALSCLLFIAPSLSINCDGLSKDQCEQNFPQCQILTAKSCCGETNSYCAERDSNDCLASKITCKKDDHGNIYEFWSSCTPKSGFTDYIPSNATCSSLNCNAQQMSCKYVQQACHETSCCPDIPQCQIPATGGGPGTGSATGQGTSGGTPGSCDKVNCPNGFNCILVNQLAVCVSATSSSSTTGSSSTTSWTSTTGSSSTTTSWTSTTTGVSTTGGSTSTTTGGSTTGQTCANVNCPRGFHCEVRGSQAVCVADEFDVCENVDCGRGYHCENGVCVRNEVKCDACDQLDCPRGYHCISQPRGGWIGSHKRRHWQLHPEHCGGRPNKIKAICVPSPKGTCKTVQCPKGYKCKLYADGPSCVKIEKPKCLTCKDMHCETNGLLCVLTPQKKIDEECCPIIPICINPSTIAASTIATTTATTRHSTASTIASLVGTTSGNGGNGGTGSLGDSSSDESTEEIGLFENDRFWGEDDEYFSDNYRYDDDEDEDEDYDDRNYDEDFYDDDDQEEFYEDDDQYYDDGDFQEDDFEEEYAFY